MVTELVAQVRAIVGTGTETDGNVCAATDNEAGEELGDMVSAFVDEPMADSPST